MDIRAVKARSQGEARQALRAVQGQQPRRARNSGEPGHPSTVPGSVIRWSREAGLPWRWLKRSQSAKGEPMNLLLSPIRSPHRTAPGQWPLCLCLFVLVVRWVAVPLDLLLLELLCPADALLDDLFFALVRLAWVSACSRAGLAFDEECRDDAAACLCDEEAAACVAFLLLKNTTIVWPGLKRALDDVLFQWATWAGVSR